MMIDESRSHYHAHLQDSLPDAAAAVEGDMHEQGEQQVQGEQLLLL